jgi:PAS domain S-box-containing protein
VDRIAFRPTAARNGGPLASPWTLVGAMLLVFGGALAWVSYEDYRETMEREYRYLDAHTRIAQERMGEIVTDVRRALTHVSDEHPVHSTQSPTDYNAWLAERTREVPAVRWIAIADPSGRITASSNPGLVGTDASKQEFFAVRQADPQRPDFHVARPAKTIDGDYVLSFSLPIFADGRRLLGVAEAVAPFDALRNVLQDVQHLHPRSAAAIVHDDGEFVLHSGYAAGGVGRNGANAAFRAFLAAGRAPMFATAVSLTDGLRRMYAIRPVEGTPLNVVMGIPLDEVLAPWRRHLLLRTLLFLCCAAFLAGLVRTMRRRRQEVRAGQEFSERLVNTANAMMLVLDHEGVITAVNEAAERVTGFRREALVGHSIFDTLMPRTRFPRAWQSFLRYREAGEVPRAFEAPIQTGSGEKRVIAWQNSAVFAESEAPAILSFGIDVTERVQLQQVRNREEISRRMVAMQEEERRRLATELHDRTSPNLTVLDINLKMLANSLPKDSPAELGNLIEDASATLADTIASIRSVSFDFRPPLLDYAGLWPALSAYARQFSRRTGIEVHMAEQDPALRLAPEVETNLFHIAQEALTNCARHSHAAEVSIALLPRDDALVLTIEDDGAGFDPGGVQGMGMVMMRQRAAFIGGRLELSTQRGKGTRLSVSFSAATSAANCAAPRAIHPAASHASAFAPAARPLAKHAVSR